MDTLLDLCVRLLEWAFGSFRNRVSIKRVVKVKPLDKDLNAAFELYKRRLPPNERDSSENIVRWLEECENAGPDESSKLQDYLLIAKAAGQVCGLLYAQYYPHTRLLVISYLVIDNSSPQQSSVVPAFLKYFMRLLRTEAKGCVGLAFELEHPAHSSKPRRCLGREELFRRHFRCNEIFIKRLAIDYRQPRLSLWDDDIRPYHEEAQLLMYGRIQPPPLGDLVSKVEVAAVIDTMYNYWYGDCYEDNPNRDQEYRTYLRELCQKTVASLPEEVPLN